MGAFGLLCGTIGLLCGTARGKSVLLLSRWYVCDANVLTYAKQIEKRDDFDIDKEDGKDSVRIEATDLSRDEGYRLSQTNKIATDDTITIITHGGPWSTPYNQINWIEGGGQGTPSSPLCGSDKRDEWTTRNQPYNSEDFRTFLNALVGHKTGIKIELIACRMAVVAFNMMEAQVRVVDAPLAGHAAADVLRPAQLAVYCTPRVPLS